jgi:hypothetical protein
MANFSSFFKSSNVFARVYSLRRVLGHFPFLKSFSIIKSTLYDLYNYGESLDHFCLTLLSIKKSLINILFLFLSKMLVFQQSISHPCTGRFSLYGSI